MRRPSGDQRNSPSSPVTRVSCSAGPPPNAARQRLRVPDRVETNASQCPFGDQAGALAAGSTRAVPRPIRATG